MARAQSVRVCLCWMLIASMVCPPQVLAGDSIFGGWAKKKSRPKTQLEQLAEAVDKLEREIDCYGSVVIKQPDIWGEARWTSHRQEFEKTMKDELKNFKFTLNARITEADTSFALMAASLSAASGGAVGQPVPAPAQPQPIDAVTGQPFRTLEVQQPSVVDTQGNEIKGITIEPTVYLDQMARYIKHLHQLRRVNEGDDTADASGYALILMRIPASILPGSKTRTGYGAELTVTVTPELSEDLLPETFKDLVFNDLVDQLSLPILRLAEQRPWESEFSYEQSIEYQKEKARYSALADILKSLKENCDCQGDVSSRCDPGYMQTVRNNSVTAASMISYLFGDNRCAKYNNIPEHSRNNIAKERDDIRNAIIVTARENGLSEFQDVIGEITGIPDKLQNLCDSAKKNTLEVQDKVSIINRVVGNVQTVRNSRYGNFKEHGIMSLMPFQKDSPNDQKNQTLFTLDEESVKEYNNALGHLVEIGYFNKNDVLYLSHSDEMQSYPSWFMWLLSLFDEMRAINNSNQAARASERVQESINEAKLRINESRKIADSISDKIANALVEILDQSVAQIPDSIISVAGISSGVIATPRTSAARYSIPPTQIVCVFGDEHIKNVAKDIATFQHKSQRKTLHIFDVQGFLAEELEAAYGYLQNLEDERGVSPWNVFCPQISKSVRLLKYKQTDGHEALCKLRKDFDCFAAPPVILNGPNAISAISYRSPSSPQRLEVAPPPYSVPRNSADKKQECDECECNVCTTKALAWAILVDSALLNEQLYDDMNRIQKAKHTYFAPEYNPGFYGPNPSPEAKEIFNQYVQARWPIHVFALDPEVQEQNVSDAYARRRETQLALAMAFSNGEIGAKTFSRYARQTDFHLDTIALNRTVIGFSHGSDTFGWRFYPRVQVPPTPGRFKASWQTWVSGAPSRDDDLKCRQLETGPRELLAIVIMPSFLPYLRVDSRTNWFKLTDPKCKEFTTEDSVRMGHMIQYIHNCKESCMHENHMYRPGDVMRVMQAVNQLEKRLPLQDTLAQIPYENDLGGYRLFALGKRNLGPELIGFYGEPGVNLKGNTHLFLVGRGFNVNTTQVIAGGQKCDFDLLSRDVMRIEVKKDAYTTKIKVTGKDGKEKEEDRVDIHVATPYGVSGHLFVPVINESTQTPGVSFAPAEVYGCLQYDNLCLANAVSLAMNELNLNAPPFRGKTASAKLSMTAVFADGSERALQKDNKAITVDLDKFTNGVFSFNSGDLKKFFDSTPRLVAVEQPIALRVSAVVEGENGSVQTRASNQLLIKLAVQQPKPCCPTPQEMMWVIPQAIMRGCCP